MTTNTALTFVDYEVPAPPIIVRQVQLTGDRALVVRLVGEKKTTVQLKGEV